MNNRDVAISAKLGMIEFMLEVLMARHVAAMDQPVSDSFKNELESRPIQLRSGIMDSDALETLTTRVQAECKRFVARVAERESDFRQEERAS